MCAMNWSELGRPDKATASNRWFYATLLYYGSLPVLMHWLYSASPAAAAMELPLILAPLILWSAIPAREQIKYATAHSQEIIKNRSWRIPLTIAFGIIFGLIGMVVSLGILMEITTNPELPKGGTQPSEVTPVH